MLERFKRFSVKILDYYNTGCPA